MDLSFQNQNFGWNQIESLDLVSEKIRLKSGQEEDLNLEKIWPGFVFLKAMNFEAIEFRSPSGVHIESWLQRMEAYQQAFLEDPESVNPDECAWNEINETNLNTVIECIARTIRIENRSTGLYDVPPMEAPLAVEPHALRSFLHEVEHQRAEDILLRLQAILREYQSDSKGLEPGLWSALVADIIGVALEARLVDKAVRLAEEHRDSLRDIWMDTDRSLRLLSVYEPTKSQEVLNWSRVFETLGIDRLVHYFQNHLSSKAGPQIIRLMQHRASQKPEELVKLCFESGPALQKKILQWLSAHWGPQHYTRLYEALENELEANRDPENTKSWIQALLKSHPAQALKDLKKFFGRPSLKQKLFSKSRESEAQKQKSIVIALAELPSNESINFLKEIRSSVRGEMADEIERQLQTHQARRGGL